MNEELRQGFELYKQWADLFYNQLTKDDWNRLYERKDLSAEEQKLVDSWNRDYSDPTALINQAYNYMYKLVESGRTDELPEDIKQLVRNWNN